MRIKLKHGHLVIGQGSTYSDYEFNCLACNSPDMDLIGVEYYQDNAHLSFQCRKCTKKILVNPETHMILMHIIEVYEEREKLDVK